jgi:hypothetical protein
VDFVVTELNWTQLLSEHFGVLAGKNTTIVTANEFMGGEGRTQFLNRQMRIPIPSAGPSLMVAAWAQ